LNRFASHRLDRPRRRNESKPAPERLEGRTLLAAQIAHHLAAVPLDQQALPAMILRLDPASDPMHDGLVFANRVILTGRASPGALVRLHVGPNHIASVRTRADAQGDYRFAIRVPLGAMQAKVAAIEATGQTATASLTFTCANPVIAWNAVALQAIRLDKTPPPMAARNLAITQLAIDQAVEDLSAIAAKSPAGAGLLNSAVAKAGHDALVALFPDQQALFDAALTASLAGLPTGTALSLGRSIGSRDATLQLAARSHDGANTTVAYTPSTDVGKWRPTPPGFAPALYPQWPRVTPFVLASATQFRPPAPPSLDSAEYAAALNQVESLGGKDSTVRTTDQTEIALFWADNAGTATPPGHWNEIAATVALQRHDSLLKDARLFAMLDVALADAGIACWDSKYAYNYWRPVTAIRSAGQDGNPQTTADPSWTPLLATPPFPSYVSGHSTFSAAAAVVLSRFFGPQVNLTIGSDGLTGVTRHYTSFAAAAQEAGISRIYAGIHYAFDDTQGQALGQAVGQYVVSHWKPPRA
jgi:membrane-associated phospholipid phosphatase